jgi:hypothetical protein
MSKIAQWYLVQDDTKHMRQVVLLLPPEAEVPPRVKGSLIHGVQLMTQSWAGLTLFMGEGEGKDKGPFVFSKANDVVELLKGCEARVAFTFYRFRHGGVLQIFVTVESPEVEARSRYPFITENAHWPDNEDTKEIIPALFAREHLEVCFVADGPAGPCLGHFGLRVAVPKDCREILTKEWQLLQEYHSGIPQGERDRRLAMTQFEHENPMEENPVLPKQVGRGVTQEEAESFRKIKMKAETLEKAREEIQSSIPEGFVWFSEKIISDGQQLSVSGSGDTIDVAFEQADRKKPEGAAVERRMIIHHPEKVILVAAFDAASAEAEARKQMDKIASLERIEVKEKGRKGFLGFGKKPNIYEAFIRQPAVVALVVNQQTVVEATFARKAEQEIEFEVEAPTLVGAVQLAIKRVNPGYLVVARSIIKEEKDKVRLWVKVGESPLLKLPPHLRKKAMSLKAEWRARAERWWASSGRSEGYCDNNGCLIDGKDLMQSKFLCRGEGFMPGGRPIWCEECADTELYQRYRRS